MANKVTDECLVQTPEGPDRIMNSQIVAYECYPASKDECTCSWYRMFCVNIGIILNISIFSDKTPFLLTKQAKVLLIPSPPLTHLSILSQRQRLMWQLPYVFLPKFIFFLWTSGSYMHARCRPMKLTAALAAVQEAPWIYLCPAIRVRRLVGCQQRPTGPPVLT